MKSCSNRARTETADIHPIGTELFVKRLGETSDEGLAGRIVGEEGDRHEAGYGGYVENKTPTTFPHSLAEKCAKLGWSVDVETAHFG